MTKTKSFIIGLLVALVIIVFVLNFYFVSFLSIGQNDGNTASSIRITSKNGILNQVKKRVKHLQPVYLNRNPRYYNIRNKVWRNFDPKPYENASNVFEFAYWVSVISSIYIYINNGLPKNISHKIRIIRRKYSEIIRSR